MSELVVKGIPEALKARFKVACKENNTRMSDVVISLLRKVVGDDSVSDERVANRERKLTLRLTQGEVEMLLDRQIQENDSVRTITAVNALRRGLDARPVLNGELVKALRESNRELAAIGRNLNQVARAINTDPRLGESVRYEAIQELVGKIDEHRTLVARTIQNAMDKNL